MVAVAIVPFEQLFVRFVLVENELSILDILTFDLTILKFLCELFLELGPWLLHSIDIYYLVSLTLFLHSALET